MGNAAPGNTGEALARLRMSQGLSARQLAVKVGVAHHVIDDAERGGAVGRDVLDRLARVLGSQVRAIVPVWPPAPEGTTAIAKARAKTGESIRQAAKRAGVSFDVFKRAESGIRVHPANAKKIADAFELDVADVLPLPPSREAPDPQVA